MVARCRFALMWLLLLALPLQGFAAATTLGCGPNHERLREAAAPTESQAHDERRDHHHAMGADPVVGTAGVGDEAAAVHHLDKVSKFKCSACASCCIGAALPAAALVFAAFAPATARACFVSRSHVGFYTDGPDRPPRLVLA